MAECFIGEIRPFSFGFAPKNWAVCQGQLLAIAQNTALFSLLGTTYGGNGQSTFALPDLRRRAPIGSGQGPGLSDYALGQAADAITVGLVEANLPQHLHAAQASSAAGNRRDPFSIAPAGGHRWAGSDHVQYATGNPDTTLAPQSIGATGGGQPHPNESPYLVCNYCIALVGTFPSRN